MRRRDLRSPMTSADVDRSRFTPARLGESYDMRQVDDFLDSLSGVLAGGPRLGDGQLESTRFRRTWMREGYRSVEVDRFLDWARATLRASDEGAYRPPSRFRIHLSPMFLARMVALAVVAGTAARLMTR